MISVDEFRVSIRASRKRKKMIGREETMEVKSGNNVLDLFFLYL
jgi:hypothetical protein